MGGMSNSHQKWRFADTGRASTSRTGERPVQNSFVGDVGDLAKYSLLRALLGLSPAAQPLLSLGVVWYVPDAATARRTPWRHGKDVGYLFNERAYREYRDRDPVLFDELERIVCKDRTLDAVQESDLLGSDTQYWDRPILLPDDRSARVSHRKRWLAEARDKVKGRDLVFLDPDTGMAHEHRAAPKRLSRTQRDAPSYAFVDEVETTLSLHRTGERLATTQLSVQNRRC